MIETEEECLRAARALLCAARRTPEVLYERVVEVDELVVLPLGDTPST